MLDLRKLNPQQRQAVQSLRGPVLILAGAGTGKTRVITTRIAHLIASGIAPDQILAVTFTNKAAREMQERVRQLLPKQRRSKDQPAAPARPTICTFHSLGARILREHIERLGYKRSFVIYDESEQLSVVKKILSHLGTRDKVDPYELLALLSRQKNQAAGHAPTTSAQAADLFSRIHTRYQTALHACNAVDFDDLLLLPLRLFREHPDILEACRRRFRYVMVDEYQDTNAVQFQLLHLLCQQHRNLCVVGDDDQSIYGWRGAEIANLLDLETHYPEVKIIKLEQNYRSHNTILQVANALIQNNVRRRGKQLWSNQGHGQPIEIHAFEDDTAEAQFAAERIEFERLSRRIPWGHQAVLFRTNQQSRALELALRQASIRYHLIGGQSFFDRREVRDFLAYLKLFLNPHNDVSLLRIANVPARGLSDATMERLLAASQQRHCSVYQAMRDPQTQSTLAPRTRQHLQDFLDWISRHQQLLQAAPPLRLVDWANRFLNEIGYLTELRRLEKNSESAENRIRNLKDLIQELEPLQTQHPAKSPTEQLQQFLEEITLDNEREEDSEQPRDAVTLITMHSCKGLEFPHVLVVGVEDGLLPHTRSKEEGTLDEERRLFYVAITRAMKSLALTYCHSRKKYGQASPCHPSPFLKELPANLVEHAADKARQPVPSTSGKHLFSAMRASLES